MLHIKAIRNPIQDSSARVFTEKLKVFDKGIMTIGKCLEECKDYKYAAVQNHRECFCGDEFRQETKFLKDSECNRPCDGDQTQMCGGGWKMNVYTV